MVEGLRVQGKRTRKFFRTRREAEVWLRRMLARMRKEGEIAIHMPEQLRVEAMTCAEYLRPYGKTLTEATQHFIAYLRSIERSCTVQTVISEFKISKKQDGKAKSYLRDIKHRLDVFENSDLTSLF